MSTRHKSNLDFIDSEDKFLIWLINHMSGSFGPKIILRGGMILRLLDSPRATHDLDYAFIGFDSKKQIVAPILNSLKNYGQIKVDFSLHSTNVRFDIKLKNENGLFHTLLEANVIKDCPSIVISTGETAKKYHLEPKLILTMKHEIALANKLAAWVERRLVRDLYDAYYYHRFVDVRPDLPILSLRLKKLNYADKKLRRTAPKSLSLMEFCDLLSKEVRLLDEKTVKSGLINLEANLLPGLLPKIRSALLEMIDWILDNRREILR